MEERMRELIYKLNSASESYYSNGDEIMSNYEWDAMFDELLKLEEETGIVLEGSPTAGVSYSDNEKGEKEEHEFPALSLAKTKQVSELVKWAEGREVWVSWKLDGLTLVITYDNGRLSKIVTRGNGHVGTNITYMKESLFDIPLKISDRGHLVVRGEAVISYPDFEEINLTEDSEEPYKNPRNLASGTLALDTDKLDVVKSRRVHFVAFSLIYTQKKIESFGKRMDYLHKLGFNVVEREKTAPADIKEVVDNWTKKVENGQMLIPVDGLVITYEDAAYAATGSVTGHHATRAGFAFKWQDEEAETTLVDIEWSCAASVITPVALFEPVELEGTTVSRASLCNISELERLGIGGMKETKIAVIKANKIIPKVVRVLEKKGEYDIPKLCPVCMAETKITISENSGTKTLICTNPDCAAKNIKKFEMFVSKEGMDMDGLSKKTIAKFINMGLIKSYDDLYHLNNHEDTIISMEGMGRKSYDKLIAAIDKSRNVKAENFIRSFSIPLVGVDTAGKLLTDGMEDFVDRIITGKGFSDVKGIGPEKSASVMSWFSDNKNFRVFEAVKSEVSIIEKEKPSDDAALFDKTFVITGEVHSFKNRDEFKAYVQSMGGKVAGSVSSKTDYLVNNDSESSSSKNIKAKELGIPIITEDEFIRMFGK